MSTLINGREYKEENIKVFLNGEEFPISSIAIPDCIMTFKYGKPGRPIRKRELKKMVYGRLKKYRIPRKKKKIVKKHINNAFGIKGVSGRPLDLAKLFLSLFDPNTNFKITHTSITTR